MGNASGREEDVAAAYGDGADVEDGGGEGDSSVRSSERGFPPYGSGGANHVQRACSVGVVGGSGGSPPGSPGRSLSPRMFVPQVKSRDPAHPPRFGFSLG
jgi:5'-AMP-activated protein kinase, regulatory beta subunit